MDQMLHNINEWPKRHKTPKWAHGHCFTGSLLGMLKLNTSVFAVGQILYENRQFEDQVYQMKVPAGSDTTIVSLEIEFNVLINSITYTLIQRFLSYFIIDIKSGDTKPNTPHNMRTFFGCRPSKKKLIKPVPHGRKKRDIDEEVVAIDEQREQPVQQNNYWLDSIGKELSDDWTQLTLLSMVCLILIYIIIHFSIEICRGRHPNKND